LKKQSDARIGNAGFTPTSLCNHSGANPSTLAIGDGGVTPTSLLEKNSLCSRGGSPTPLLKQTTYASARDSGALSKAFRDMEDAYRAEEKAGKLCTRDMRQRQSMIRKFDEEQIYAVLTASAQTNKASNNTTTSTTGGDIVVAITSNMETSTANDKATTSNLDTSTLNMDTSTANEEATTSNLDTSTSNMDMSTANDEATTSNLDTSTVNDEWQRDTTTKEFVKKVSTTSNMEESPIDKSTMAFDKRQQDTTPKVLVKHEALVPPTNNIFSAGSSNKLAIDLLGDDSGSDVNYELDTSRASGSTSSSSSSSDLDDSENSEDLEDSEDSDDPGDSDDSDDSDDSKIQKIRMWNCPLVPKGLKNASK
jgi:hypothetical protein